MPSIDTETNLARRHSEDVQDIIVTVPSGLFRWGITLFFGIVVLMIGLGVLIRYPDIIKGKLRIAALNPPKLIVTKMPGKLVKLLVTRNEIVKSGDPLALLESISDHSKYLLNAPTAGKISFAGIIMENQLLETNQELFYLTPGNEAFFGEMEVPQDNMGMIKEGQQVLIKLKAYPFETYGVLSGKVKDIAEVPNKDGIFIALVDFKIETSSNLKKAIHLKQGMTADAEIVTQDVSILQRLRRNLFKLN